MIEDWFPDWLSEHHTRHSHALLPALATEEGQVVYKAWVSVFRKRGIMDLAIATEASERLLGETLKYPREHFPKLVELAVAIYAERRPSGSEEGTPSERFDAEKRSGDCEGCQGCGLASVEDKAASLLRGYVVRVSRYCPLDCPLSRWMEMTHRKSHPDVWRRLRAGGEATSSATAPEGPAF